MPFHQRERLIAALAPVRQAMLATGAADVQADLVRCTARGALLYLVVPAASGHLRHIAAERRVAVVTPAWQVRGVARLLLADEPAPLADVPAGWHVVEVRPTYVALFHGDGWDPAEIVVVDE